MIVGVDPAMAPKGGFHPVVSEIARVFPGSLAVVAARGPHHRDPQRAPFDVLVPVTGTEVSRRGAEVALAIAKAAGSPLMVLSVLPPSAGIERERLATARRDAAEAVKEIKALADAYELPIKSAIRTDISAADAILRQPRRGRHDLIVLGVSRRPGKTLSFGELATALLESSDRSLMFVAPLPATTAHRSAQGAGTAGSERAGEA